MRTVCKIYLITFIAILSVSCKSDDDATDPDGQFMTANVIGDDNFVSTPDLDLGAFDARYKGFGNDAHLDFFSRMDGVNQDFSEIGGKIYNYTGVGTYRTGESADDRDELNFLNRGAVNYYSGASSIGFDGFEPGTFVITKDDGEFIEGTFQFIGFKFDGAFSRTVTNGSFKLKLR